MSDQYQCSAVQCSAVRSNLPQAQLVREKELDVWARAILRLKVRVRQDEGLVSGVDSDRWTPVIITFYLVQPLLIKMCIN